MTMHSETGSRQTYTLKRTMSVDDAYDIVVSGGGPAGCAAAIAAGRLGAKVLLLEATGCLGGMATSGLVPAFAPMSDGSRLLTDGIMREILEQVHRRGWTAPQVTPDFWERTFHRWVPFNPEGLKVLLDELVSAANVEVRFFTKTIDAGANQHDRCVEGIVTHDIQGYRYVGAKTFIDATGDAVLADICGVPCRRAGRDTRNIMPPTLCSYCAGVDWDQAKADPIDDGPAHQQELLERAIADGHFTHQDRHLPGLFQMGRTVGMLNAGHVFGMDALDAKSLSAGMAQGRRLAQEYLAFYRRYVPGCENIEQACTAALMGVRESRRIVGEYELNIDDYLARRQFGDQIGVFNASVDIHVYDDSPEEYERYYQEFTETGRLQPGECFGLPYGIMVPAGWNNLWVPGRPNSSDVQVHGCIRVQPAAVMMGQAAGSAAVQAIRTGQPACDLDTAELANTLRRHGAYLPQEKLSRKMTRSSQ